MATSRSEFLCKSLPVLLLNPNVFEIQPSFWLPGGRTRLWPLRGIEGAFQLALLVPDSGVYILETCLS